MSTELQIGQNIYRIDKLPPRIQFHVTRRLGPVLGSFGASIFELVNAGKKLASDADLFSVMGPVMDLVAKMSDEDADYVINNALSVVRRKEGEKWAAVIHANGSMLYQDIEMPEMMRLVVEVVRENLGNFFSPPPDEPGSQTGS